MNGADWRFDELSTEAVADKIDDFLEFVAISLEREETVWIGEDFSRRAMFGDSSLWEMLYELPLPEEMRHEMGAWLGRAKCYLDWDDWPNGPDIKRHRLMQAKNVKTRMLHGCITVSGGEFLLHV